VDERNYETQAIKCDQDGKWRSEKGICPFDAVNHPTHYTNGKVECIDAIESAVTGLDGVEAVLTGHIIRYVWRWKQKGGVEDLRKAEWYLKRLIQKQNGH
jgi:hypothetical protein